LGGGDHNRKGPATLGVPALVVRKEKGGDWGCLDNQENRKTKKTQQKSEKGRSYHCSGGNRGKQKVNLRFGKGSQLPPPFVVGGKGK